MRAGAVLDAALELHVRGTAPVDGHEWRDAAVRLAVERAWTSGDHDVVTALADGYGGLVLLVPQVVDGDVRLVPAGTGERRRRGAFGTPPALAAVLARHALPERPTAGAPSHGVPTVIDPAAGTGALLRAALHRLLALGAAPAEAFAALHGVELDATAVAVCRAVLAVEALRCEAAADRAAARALADRRVVPGDALLGPTPLLTGPGTAGPALHEAFPHVLDRPDGPAEPVTGWRGGFDAVLANPPWERLKVTARDWPDGRGLPALRAERAGAAREVRSGGRHPLTGTGEVNAYLPFVETCWRLLGPRGRAALVVPAGIASDRSSSALQQALLTDGALELLHLLEPATPLFDGVSGRVGVAVLVLRHGSRGRPHPPDGRGAAGAQVAVGLPDAAADPGDRAWTLDAQTLMLVNPNTATMPLFSSARDAAVVRAVHRRHPVLRRRSPDGVLLDDPWQLRLHTSLHMTRDARWFAAAPGPGLVPLWEAKHAGLLDHRGGARRDHRYWVPAGLMHDRYGELAARGWLAAYRNVTTVDSPRTLLPCALPVEGVANSLPLLWAPRLPLLLAALASLPVDHLVRARHAGANLNFFKLEQVPLPPPERYDLPAPWDPSTTVAAWVLDRFAAAVAWHGDGAGGGELSALAAELGHTPVGPPDPGRRAMALADLDAAHAVLLGLDRCDLVHVLSTFPALRRRDERLTSRPATRERVLAAYDRLVTGPPSDPDPAPEHACGPRAQRGALA